MKSSSGLVGLCVKVFGLFFASHLLVATACAQSATITVASIPTTVAGNTISVAYTVTNTGTSSRTFGVGAEIRDNSSSLADLGGQTTPTISPGGRATGSFSYTIPAGWSGGTYIARAAVWTGTPGSSTRLNTYDRSFTVQARVTNATITVASISPVVAGSSISVSYTVTNTGNYSRMFGVGTEIRQNGSLLDPVGTTTTSPIAAGSTATGSFNYTIPSGWSGGTYTARAAVWTGTPGSTTFLNSYDRNFTVQARVTNATITVASISPVVAGNSISISYTVTNTGNYSRTFGVGSEIRQNGSLLDPVGTKTTSTVGAGGTASGSFNYTIPSGWSSGTYTARAAVWTGTPGSSTFLNSFDRDFTVQQAPLTITGKLTYHSYSAYLAAPIDADDGHIFLFTLPNGALRRLTQGLPVQNAMNPHTAPDGSRIVFMAIPQGQTRDYNLLEVYLYDLAQEVLTRLTTNGVPDEDAKFSPDGQKVVFKRSGQIWTMNADGSGVSQLTSTAREKSGPCFSPDGSRIVFWYDSKSSADVGWMLANSPNSDTVLFGDANYQDMYPIYRDSDTILYSRWESADANPAPPNPSDDLYAYSISTDTKTKLGSTQFNLSNTEDADAFPVQSALVGFSSTRSVAGAKGSYDIYIGNPQTDAIYQLGGMNSQHQDLGGWYSPYSDARKMVVLNPVSGAQLTSSGTVVFTARGYSNGGVWSGATPKIVLQGPVNIEFTGLHDDGINGDQAAGDGIYSKSVTLPAQVGNYTAYASAGTTDNSITHEIRSASLSLSLVPSLISVTVQPNSTDRSFSVDGTSYTTAQNFSWVSGSSHTIAATSTQSGGTGIQYVWSSWSDGGGMSHTVAPTSGTTYTANFTTQYYLTMNAGTGGTVSPSSGWYNSGAGVAISATLNSGYSFSSWIGSGSGSYSGNNNLASATINAPITETASFTCIYTLGPTNEEFGAGAGSGSFNVASGGTCSWTTVATQAWIHTSSSGNGNGLATYTVDANPTGNQRSGTITVQGSAFPVMQHGCSNYVDPGEISQIIPAAGGTFCAKVISTSENCAWSAGNNGCAWFTLSCDNGCDGSANVCIIVEQNASPQPRHCQVTIAGQTFEINQSGSSELPPSVTALKQGSNLVLSWPTNDPAFKLFYATNLSTTAWISNPVVPAIVSGQYTITNGITNNARFYRLKK